MRYERHGYTTGGTAKIYRRWYEMIQRCHNPKHPDYSYYGGRGITVCARWRKSLTAFVADMGLPKEGMTLDRTNNNKGYSKYNCRWATRAEQSKNRGYTIRLLFRKKMRTLREISKLTGLSVSTLYFRYKRGKLSVS